MRIYNEPPVDIERDGIRVNGSLTSWKQIDAAREAIQRAQLKTNPNAFLCPHCNEYVATSYKQQHVKACKVKNANIPL